MFFCPGIMNYARFLTAVSAARKPSPIRLLSKYCMLKHFCLNVELNSKPHHNFNK